MSASIADVKAAVTCAMFLESIGVQVLPAAREQKFRCIRPGHADKNPSGTIYKGGQAWYCFPCRKGGDVLDLARLRYPGTLSSVLRLLADRFSVSGATR